MESNHSFELNPVRQPNPIGGHFLDFSLLNIGYHIESDPIPELDPQLDLELDQLILLRRKRINPKRRLFIAGNWRYKAPHRAEEGQSCHDVRCLEEIIVGIPSASSHPIIRQIRSFKDEQSYMKFVVKTRDDWDYQAIFSHDPLKHPGFKDEPASGGRKIVRDICKCPWGNFDLERGLDHGFPSVGLMRYAACLDNVRYRRLIQWRLVNGYDRQIGDYDNWGVPNPREQNYLGYNVGYPVPALPDLQRQFLNDIGYKAKKPRHHSMWGFNMLDLLQHNEHLHLSPNY
jgi:hypothetical protein